MSVKVPVSQRRRAQHGFFLGELILAVLIIGAFITMTVKLSVDMQADTVARQTGAYTDQFAAAAQAYYLANSTEMLAVMADGTGAAGHCNIGVNPADGTGGTVNNDTALHTCALDATWLQYKGALPAGFNPLSGRNSRWVAVYRSPYDGATQTGDVEMLVVTARDGAAFDVPMTMPELVLGAESAGAGGGYVPGIDAAVCVDNRATATYEACGAGMSWKVSLTNFITAAELTIFSDALPN